MKLYSLSLLTAGLLVLTLSSPVQAQDPDSGGPTPTPSSPTAVPIDAGASLLLAAGAAYGLRRLSRKA
ncbi:hypothetical protein LJY25_02820 [Hymenobacter sp. BT175]|uniref:PID-CTERM protein-sorting domain-containing protein n=1 Tax=Hymenobacter translucens TaxID=2886507 RepID=UPI001D0E5B22|nr:hypothetical protein [Hymenobacter translucens]MCC2545364.1 hypothetical protein [Hymenobacter translucens]